MEDGTQLKVHPELLRAEYLARLEDHIEGIRQDCAEARVDFELADTSRPCDHVLASYLAKRSRMGG